MSECKHNFKLLGGMSTKAFWYMVLWNVALLSIVIVTIYLFQFYWIVLILVFASGLSSNQTIYCNKCGEIRKPEEKE